MFKNVFSWSVKQNNCKEFCESIADHIQKLEDLGEKIDSDIKKEMIKRDSFIEIDVYPRTQVSFFTVYHYDFDQALEIMKKYLEDDGKPQNV